MQTFEVDAVAYWKNAFTALCSRERLTEFIVVDVDYEHIDVNTSSTSKQAARNKFKMVQVEIARVEDFGVNDDTFIVKTHLGELLNYNDHVLGYNLSTINLAELEDLRANDKKVSRNLPDVIIVKKHYPKVRSRRKNRIWKLKQLTKVQQDENNTHKKNNIEAKREIEYETFLNDLDEDPELRHQV
eukprot:CAMPEP_0116882746 /NCGR_PEP_ID=MMETSP0463-20121206/15106_1 /TAXON_ID=181622 /ORGANISM="Strombidinopsis sp, Strain SopsisLIS2011" /LENGTH=185 /DNA_ID=CAMNT_0004536495 /DNA_START=921 /DNA_END=1478 /DNA_ORIENTATION=-